jgi:hypothetical protein
MGQAYPLFLSGLAAMVAIQLQQPVIIRFC